MDLSAWLIDGDKAFVNVLRLIDKCAKSMYGLLP